MPDLTTHILHHRERSALTVLLLREWTAAGHFDRATGAGSVIKQLTEQGWVEQRWLGWSQKLRITPAGREALKTRISVPG